MYMRRVGRESMYLGTGFFIIKGRERNHEYLETNCAGPQNHDRIR